MARHRVKTQTRLPGSIDVQWRSDKAQGFKRAAEECRRANEYNACVSRAYYAAYHLVAASLETKFGLTRKPWEHKTLLTDFRERFCIRSFFFNKRHANFFDELMQLRYTADYEDAELGLHDAHYALEILQEIESIASEVLSHENNTPRT